MMLDLDLFKTVNDTFGHNIGDEVLKEFAEVLRHHSRQSDVAGRVGGEEFAVMLPETTARAAEEVAIRIAEHCRTIAVSASGASVNFSCSIGVTEAKPADETVEGVLHRADAALYQAKRNGRDRVEVLHSTTQSVA
jgi:diguanylate cyclase (GGDEF)-like protein